VILGGKPFAFTTYKESTWRGTHGMPKQKNEPCEREAGSQARLMLNCTARLQALLRTPSASAVGGPMLKLYYSDRGFGFQQRRN
jgi:hypothetical protein